VIKTYDAERVARFMREGKDTLHAVCPSESRPGLQHTLTVEMDGSPVNCECEYYENTSGGFCKHTKASRAVVVEFWRRLHRTGVTNPEVLRRRHTNFAVDRGAALAVRDQLQLEGIVQAIIDVRMAAEKGPP
jgi:hypothetical protein